MSRFLPSLLWVNKYFIKKHKVHKATKSLDEQKPVIMLHRKPNQSMKSNIQKKLIPMCNLRIELPTLKLSFFLVLTIRKYGVLHMYFLFLFLLLLLSLASISYVIVQ